MSKLFIEDENINSILSFCLNKNKDTDFTISSMYSFNDSSLIRIIKNNIVARCVMNHLCHNVISFIKEEFDCFSNNPIEYINNTNVSYLKVEDSVSFNSWTEALYNYFLIRYYAKITTPFE